MIYPTKTKTPKKMFDDLFKKLNKAKLYDWYPYEQTKEGLKTRKLIEYAKITEFDKNKSKV